MKRLGLAHLWVLGLVWMGLSVQAQTLPREVRERIVASTVLITFPIDAQTDSIGSGTLISPSGYILTNYHVIGDTDSRSIAPKIYVGTIRFVDQPPEIKYLAKVVAADPNLDLALIRIVSTADGKPVGNLNLPAMPIGDSNSLVVGDPIYVFGFQGTGGMTLSFSRGAVGGFTGEDKESGGKQWIKHDAQTGPGNSGGGVYNQEGELIGIHSAGVSGQNNSRTGFMRPVALAWGLVGPNVPNLVRSGTPQQAVPSPTASLPTAWPPRVGEGQVWQVQVQGGQWSGTWTVTLSSRDSDGDPVGSAVSGNKTLNALMWQKDNILRLNLGDDKYPYARCRFDPQNYAGSMQGKLYVFKDANSDSQEIGTCVASPKTAPVANAAAWPPKLAVGQKWQISLQGNNLNESGTLTLLQADSNGDIEGDLVFKNYKLLSFFFISDKGNALLDMTEPEGADSGVSWLRCRFEPQSSTTALTGKLQFFNTDKDGNISNLKDIGTCKATLGR
ncbi:S1 family peptidase [Meiothermus granaticius]|uniref:Serine protease HtrA-like protein n=1 Tax=Meiothermus granaticius NBRC 107808 TaxID=1227551 RepID=A0A399F8I0_9DEIN|nr:serine protease [Meiothermus granaticius]RIH92015.1 Serine protease HtrA-like protein [Meiothermus granaticius NBRC 107808]GEM86876.1 hypothetical protein MGR01S_15010 [Meiothermus granaticius NBRC 107808]